MNKFCDTCSWWANHEDNPGTTRRECHRYPPVLHPTAADETSTGVYGYYPLTDLDDWCGEWAAKEAAPFGDRELVGLDFQNRYGLFHLEKAGITTVLQVLEMTDRELLAIPGFGRRALWLLRDALKRAGYLEDAKNLPPP